MVHKLSPFLMFQKGDAEEAMRFYVGLFPRSEIVRVDRFGPGEPGPEGTVKRGEFVVAGQPLICFDSYVKHAFSFTPSVSLFVECESVAELDAAYEQLAVGGEALMPPDNYGFSQKFAWLNDRFGVSWQLNVA